MNEEGVEREKRLFRVEEEEEELTHELSKEQKKAAISEAKRAYGHDWKKMLFGAAKSLRINRETLQTLHGMGVGDSPLKKYNDPRAFRR